MMFLKKNKETMKKLGKNMPAKKLLSQLLIRIFLMKKAECLVTMFSTEPAFFCSQFLDQYQLKHINLLVNKKA